MARVFEGILGLHLLILLANSHRVFRDLRIARELRVIESSENEKLFMNFDDQLRIVNLNCWYVERYT